MCKTDVPQSDPRIRQLTPDVFVFESYANASMVATRDGVIAIDTPMSPRNSVPWAKFIEQRGPLRYLVYTEHHPDHTAGTLYMKPEAVIASETTAAQMLHGAGTTERVRRFLDTWARDPLIDPGALADFRMIQPSMTFSERMTLDLGGRRFALFLAPGHAKGQTVVHAIDDRIAFIGDAADGEPDPPRWHNGDPWAHLKTLALLESLDVDWYVSGHAPPFKRDALARTREGILKFLDGVRAALVAGRSFDDILADDTLFGAHRRAGGNTHDVPPDIRQLGDYTRRRTLEIALEAIRDRHPSRPPHSTLDPEPTDAQLTGSPAAG